MGTVLVESTVRPREHWRRAVGSGELRGLALLQHGRVGHHAGLSQVVVVILPAHFRIFLDPLLPGFPGDEGAAHGAREDAAGNDEDDSGEHDPAAPLHVGDEEQDVDEEGEQSNDHGGDGEDQQAEQEARGAGGRVEVRGDGQSEADEDEKGGDGVHDEDAGEGMADVGGEGEVAGIVEDGNYSACEVSTYGRGKGEGAGRGTYAIHILWRFWNTRWSWCRTGRTPQNCSHRSWRVGWHG